MSSTASHLWVCSSDGRASLGQTGDIPTSEGRWVEANHTHIHYRGRMLITQMIQQLQDEMSQGHWDGCPTYLDTYYHDAIQAMTRLEMQLRLEGQLN